MNVTRRGVLKGVIGFLEKLIGFLEGLIGILQKENLSEGAPYEFKVDFLRDSVDLHVNRTNFHHGTKAANELLKAYQEGKPKSRSATPKFPLA